MGSFHTSRIHSLFRDPQKIESILSEYRTSFQTNLTKRQPPLSLGQMIETLEQSLSPYLAPSGFKVIENMIRTEYRLARIFESSHMRSLLTSIEKVSQYTTQTKPLSTQEQQVSFTHFKERLSSDRKKLLNQDLTILTLSEIRAGLPLDTILQTSRI